MWGVIISSHINQLRIWLLDGDACSDDLSYLEPYWDSCRGSTVDDLPVNDAFQCLITVHHIQLKRLMIGQLKNQKIYAQWMQIIILAYTLDAIGLVSHWIWQRECCYIVFLHDLGWCKNSRSLLFARKGFLLFSFYF